MADQYKKVWELPELLASLDGTDIIPIGTDQITIPLLKFIKLVNLLASIKSPLVITSGNGTGVSALKIVTNTGNSFIQLNDNGTFIVDADVSSGSFPFSIRYNTGTLLRLNYLGSLLFSLPNSIISLFDITFSRDVTGVLRITDWVRSAAGLKRVTTQFDKVDNTLSNITGLSETLIAGRTYFFEVWLYTTSNIAGGVKAAISGTCTAINIIYEAETVSAGVPVAIGTARSTSMGNAVGDVTAVTVSKIYISGTITVNTGGTLTVQFAENATVGTSSVLIGSSMIITDIT